MRRRRRNALSPASTPSSISPNAIPSLLSPEFALTGAKPARWEAADVVRVRSHARGRNLEVEYDRARVLGHGTPEQDLARRSVDLGHTPFVPDDVDFSAIGEEVLEDYFLAIAPVTFSKERLAATLADVERWAVTDDLGEIIAASGERGLQQLGDRSRRTRRPAGPSWPAIRTAPI